MPETIVAVASLTPSLVCLGLSGWLYRHDKSLWWVFLIGAVLTLPHIKASYP